MFRCATTNEVLDSNLKTFAAEVPYGVTLCVLTNFTPVPSSELGLVPTSVPNVSLLSYIDNFVVP